jgi:type IV secretion system protein VirB6
VLRRRAATMGFFQTFWSWLNVQLTGYIGELTARVALAVEPAVVTLGTMYVMAWGYLQMSGRIEEPLQMGLQRILSLALVLGVSLRLWLYNSVIVDTFYQAPSQFAAAMIGAADPVKTIDAIWDQGGAVAGQLWERSIAWSTSSLGFMVAGLVVWLMVGMLCVYTMFLIALSSVAQAVLLALGPLFIAMLLFESTRRLFTAWLAQLVNYALITILSVLAAALLLRIVAAYAAQTAARGQAILTMDAINMVLIAVLVFLFMRQVMPIAAGLAGGVALSSFNAISRAAGWSRALGQRQSTRSAPLIIDYVTAEVPATPAARPAATGRSLVVRPETAV